MDWTKGVAQVDYSYLLELRDLGQTGFLLPPEFIEPSGVEIWEGVKTMALELLNRKQLRP